MSPSLSASIVALHVGAVRTLGADSYSAKPWTTGFIKAPVEGPLWLGTPSADGTRAALPGDAQSDLVFHGGPEKALCIYPCEHYSFWQRELGFSSFPFGAFGENFTLEGLTEADTCIGDVFRVGTETEAPLLQVSQPRQPCWKLARRWNVKDLALRVQNSGKTGWYFRVLREGYVQPGMRLQLVERLYPQWPLSLANQIMHHRKHDLNAAELLGACPSLSTSWKKTLNERAAKGDQLDTSGRLEG